MAKESHGFSYDVFISFRGQDTRYTFIGYLRDGLERKRIKIFRDDDDDDLRIGEDISPAISKAIEESNILIVVLSVNYASSKCCLDELVNILDCRKRNNKQFVFPIFYHVDPSEVRYQRNSYGQAMTKHEDRLGKNSVETWKSALSEICSLKGLHITTAKGYEIKFIEQIVQKVYDKLDSKPSHVDPVGLEHCTEKERLKKEQEEKEHKTKEKTEAHLYTIIKLARDEDLREQIENDIDYGLVVHDKVKSFRVRKQLSFNHFKEEVAKEFGIPVQFQRFWLWTKRADHSYHPDRPLTHYEEAQSVGQLSLLSNEVHDGELSLFLEVELGQDSRPIAPPDKTKDDILLSFKLYDPAKKKKLRYVGRLLVKSTSKPSEILKRLNEMAGYDPDEEIELCQEVWFNPNDLWKPIDKKLTFHASELQDGDIVGFRKAPATDNEDHVSHPDVSPFTELEPDIQINQTSLFFDNSNHPLHGKILVHTTRSKQSYCTVLSQLKIVIQVYVECDKCRTKALRTASEYQGVNKISLEGERRDQVVITGDGIDAVSLTNKMRKKFRYATLVSIEYMFDSEGEANNENPDNGIYVPPCPINVVYASYPNPNS